MIPLLSAASMREADRWTIEELGLPGAVLMEHAALGVADAVISTFDPDRVLILCGRGNNGGDGLALARLLAARGIDVEVLLTAASTGLSGDPAMNWNALAAFAVSIVEEAGCEELESALAKGPDVIVDALFGTGFDRPLGGSLAELIEAINLASVPVVAVDLPSGLRADDAVPFGPAIEAELTVTFHAPKPCHLLPPACSHCGEIAVIDISIPAQAPGQPSALITEAEDVRRLLPLRPEIAHKGTFGHLLIVGGSPGTSGAAALAARAALIGGSGLVTLAVPAASAAVVDAALLEAMTRSLGEGESLGTLDGFAAMVVGPGLGVSDVARGRLEEAIASDHPLLLDADALNLLAGEFESLRGRSAETLLTPHPGELARLLGRSTTEVLADPIGSAQEVADRSGAVILAKGHRSVITAARETPVINTTGGPQLATGGSGDVLAGLAGAFLAQGLGARRAAIVAAWLAGRAAELSADRRPGALPASEQPGWVARAWSELVS